MSHCQGFRSTCLLQAFCLLALLCLSACEDFRVPALEKLKGKVKSKPAPAEKVEEKADEQTDAKTAGTEDKTGDKAEDKTEDKTALVEDKDKKTGRNDGKGMTPEEELEAIKKQFDQPAAPVAPVAAPAVELSFLLSMNFAEAKEISGQSMELPLGVRVAADKIEVLKLDRENQPKRVRAKGKVYLESGVGEDTAKVLCQEAYITAGEIILRGKPIIQRGGSIIEGLEDSTVAYMIGMRLRVIGLHRATNSDDMLAAQPDLGPWTGGPNPILPPLGEDAVPNKIRDEMQKAAEAEALLQHHRAEALKQPEAPPAPWVKGEPKMKAAPSVKPAVDVLKESAAQIEPKMKEAPPAKQAPKDDSKALPVPGAIEEPASDKPVKKAGKKSTLFHWLKSSKAG
jgi:hypothetical protein